MKSAIILLCLVVCCQAGVVRKSSHGRIVNGEDAAPGEIPFQVSLQYVWSSFHFCGGSVLNNFYVITASHCVDGKKANEIKVIADTTSLKNPRSTHNAVKIIMHEDYNAGDSWRNDIALIKVDKEFVESATLSFVPLPEFSMDIPADSVATVSGWGRLWQGGSSPITLQKAEILIAEQLYCSEVYDDAGLDIHETHICAHDPVEETGSCHGDSGGPLTVDGKLVGLVSWAMGCALTDYPTVYTRVPKYLDWIETHAV